MTVLQNRVISICNRKTSMRLAKSEWYVLDRICIRENLKRKQLLELIDKKKDPNLGLTPSVRLFSILYLHYLAKKGQNYSYAPDSSSITAALKEMIR